jgi:hypothetical protein
MDLMDIFKLKKAVFFANRIVIFKRVGNITINIEDIDRLEYIKPSLLNYLLPIGGMGPGRLYIYLKNKMFGTLLYIIKIKYKDIFCLPEYYRKKLGIE